MPLHVCIHCFSHLECVNQQGQQEWHDYLRNSQRSLLSQHANQCFLLRLNGNRLHSCFINNSLNNILYCNRVLSKFFTWFTYIDTCSITTTVLFACESNKVVWENTITREFIIEWVINGATASLSLLNTSGSVAMDRYQQLSNMYAWHYMHAFTASHTQIV